MWSTNSCLSNHECDGGGTIGQFLMFLLPELETKIHQYKTVQYETGLQFWNTFYVQFHHGNQICTFDLILIIDATHFAIQLKMVSI